MDAFHDLLGVDRRGAFEFFLLGLADVCPEPVNRDELLYNASVLAHWAQVSTASAWDMPAPRDLADVFDRFVLETPRGQATTGLMEQAATQCLLLSGFFADQQRHRHSIQWYSQLGAGFFATAAAYERQPRKARLLATLAVHFDAWRTRHVRLSRDLRDRRYVLSQARSDHFGEGSAAA